MMTDDITISHKHALWVLLAATTLTIMAGSIIAPVLNLMRQGLAVDPASVGLIITTHGLFIALFSPLMGSLMDKVGPKRPFAIGLILYGLAGGSGLFIDSYWVLITSRAIMGIALAAFFNAITVLILNLYEGAARNRVMGWRGSTNSLGGILWPLIGGFLGTFSWHLPFAVYLIGLPLGVLALITIPDVRIEGEKTRAGQATVLKVFKEFPVLLAIYGFMFMTNLFLYALVIFLPQLLERIDITDPLHIGLFISVATFSAGVTAFNYARIRARFSFKAIFVIALVLWAIGFTVISRSTTTAVIVIAIACFGTGQGMVFPTIPLWIGETVPASFRGRFSSYIGTAGFMGQFLSPIIFSPVLVLVGLNGIFLVVAGTSALVLFIIALTHLKS